MTDEPETPTPSPRPEKPKFLTKTKFEDYEIPREVLSGLHDTGFIHCTPIQSQALPVAFEGRDVAGQAQTGTGKTAAFLVPIFSQLLGLSRRK